MERGPRRVEIKRIEKEAARKVCFSKRKSGLFKKAAELSVLCGAEICAVVCSPGGRVFTFGHPSVEAIAARFLGESWPEEGPVITSGLQTEHLHRQCTELSRALEEEKIRRQGLEKKVKEMPTMGGSSLEDMERLLQSVELLRCRVGQRAEELRFEEVMLGSWGIPLATI
ncbi:agamous-like MADS-box protein AGL61 [Wolffia australiana]